MASIIPQPNVRTRGFDFLERFEPNNLIWETTFLAPKLLCILAKPKKRTEAKKYLLANNANVLTHLTRWEHKNARRDTFIEWGSVNGALF